MESGLIVTIFIIYIIITFIKERVAKSKHKQKDSYIEIRPKLGINRQALKRTNLKPPPDNKAGALSLIENEREEGKMSLFNPGDDN